MAARTPCEDLHTSGGSRPSCSRLAGHQCGRAPRDFKSSFALSVCGLVPAAAVATALRARHGRQRTRLGRQLLALRCKNSPAEAEGLESDEASSEASSSAEDWQAFRARLVESERGQGWDARKSSANNWALLEKQDKELSQQPAWAFETSGLIEVGALLVHQPIEEQVLLDSQLSAALNASREPLELLEETEAPDTPTAAASARWAEAKRWINDSVEEALNQIRKRRRRPTDLQLRLLQKYALYQQTWQHVVLLVSHDAEGSRGLVLNRPLASNITDALGLLEEYGDFKGSAEAFVTGLAGSPVYLGGQDGKGLTVLSKYGDLDGSTELCPGIFLVPPEVALNARVLGQRRPIDFRIHLGCCKWSSGRLQKEVAEGLWRTVAASALMTLKHCLKLPKPLWSEVMELCGDEAAALSRFVRREQELEVAEDESEP